MKIVVVTGASRGIGKAIAEKFISEGWQVFDTSTDGRPTIKLANFKIFKLNLESPKSIDQFAKELAKLKVKIDSLINNAGVYLRDDDFPAPEATLRKTLEINLIGMILLTQKLLDLIKNGGHIINMSSGAGSISDYPDAHRAAYQISKIGVNMFTRSLSDYLSDRNIRVSSLNPGWVRTDMGGVAANRDPEEPANEMYKLATSNVESGFFWYKGKKYPW